MKRGKKSLICAGSREGHLFITGIAREGKNSKKHRKEVSCRKGTPGGGKQARERNRVNASDVLAMLNDMEEQGR